MPLPVPGNATNEGAKLLTKFSEIAHRHNYAREWQARTGGRIVGSFCSYVPEELLYASGVLSVRLLGGHELQDVTEPHIAGVFCPFCRDVLAQGLMGTYDYVNGLVLSHVCPQVAQSFESWRTHRPVEFSWLLWVPSKVTCDSSLPFFVDQVNSFQRALENWLGKKITEDDLRHAISVYDHNRQLLLALYERRKQHPAQISGTETMALVIASMMMDKAEHSRLLEDILAAPPSRPAVDDGVRVMVVGSENDHIDMLTLMESLGLTVVIEDHCLGSRYFWNVTPEDSDPIMAIARRYLQKPPCPLLDVERRERGEHLMKLAREYEVQGVVFLRQKFCDPHGWDQPVMQSMFEEAGLACLSLELDFTVPVGQYQTRIEAFAELFL